MLKVTYIDEDSSLKEVNLLAPSLTFLPNIDKDATDWYIIGFSRSAQKRVMIPFSRIMGAQAAELMEKVVADFKSWEQVVKHFGI